MGQHGQVRGARRARWAAQLTRVRSMYMTGQGVKRNEAMATHILDVLRSSSPEEQDKQ